MRTGLTAGVQRDLVVALQFLDGPVRKTDSFAGPVVTGQGAMGLN